MEIGLYIHIPFCRKKCGYCDFYSIPYQRNLAWRFVSCLCRQVEKLTNRYSFSTVYLGGGTPSVLSSRQIEMILSFVNKGIKENAEFTVEVNPESALLEKLRLFKESGVNRISLGIQSFREDKLEFLGRIHSVKQSLSAISNAAQAGFTNINIDLIFGTPYEATTGFLEELKQAVSLPIQHISCYNLTYEQGTPLYKQLKSGNFLPLDDNVLADIYSSAVDFLNKHGFCQYEISNFAKKGFICRHNYNYWSNKPYIGLGPSASSFVGGRRRVNISSVEEYINRANKGRDVFAGQEKLPLEKKAAEYAAVAIRKIEGIDFVEFKKDTGVDLRNLREREIRDLINRGFLEYKKGRNGIKITKKGLLFCDYISRALV